METPGKFCSFAILSPSLSLSSESSRPNTDQFSSNCVSRLARSLGPSGYSHSSSSFRIGAFCIHMRACTCTYARTRARCRSQSRNSLLRDRCDRIRSIGRIQYTPALKAMVRDRIFSRRQFKDPDCESSEKSEKGKRKTEREREKELSIRIRGSVQDLAISMKRINAKTLHPLAAIIRVRRSR